MSDRNRSEAQGARFECDECSIGRDCEKHDPPPGSPTYDAYERGWRDATAWQRSAAAQPEPCCYEAPAGIHSENCPTRAEDASTPCRKCTECEGNHHWLETLAYVCKHCELLAEGCEDCDGTGGFDGDVDSEIPCEACDGDGVIVPNQRRAAAKNDGR